MKSTVDKKIPTVNKAIRICVNCGNASVQTANWKMICKECGMCFQIREAKNE